MKIVIKGTSNEIEKAKSAVEGTCFLGSEFCDLGISCDECETKHGLEKEYIIE